MKHIKRKCFGRVLAGALAGVTPVAPAFADEPQDLTTLPLEQLLSLEIITASKFPQKINEAPSSVSVITADDIRRYGYRSLTEILRSVRGVYVTDDRNYNYVGTRGSGRPGDFNTRLLILVDGRRLNDLVYDQGAVGTEFALDVSLIERIEFVPGPGSAMYGSSAFFGVINVITKTGAAFQGTALTGGAGSFGARQARLAVGYSADGVDLLLGAAWGRRAGQDLYFPEYDDHASHGGVAVSLDHDLHKRAFAKLSLGKFVLGAYAGWRTKGIPTASYGQQFNDPRSATSDEYAAASASYQRALSDTLDMAGSINLNRYRYSGVYIYAPDSATANIDQAESRTIGAEIRLLSTAIRHHKIIAGAEYNNDTTLTMANFDIAPYLSYLSSDRSRKRAGVYLQDEIRLSDRVILNGGLRHDYDSEGGRSTNPRLALIYKTGPHSTLKALFGTAFRSPNSYERYYATTMGYKLNPHLKPEKINTIELIGEYFPAENFRANLSIFQYRLTDLIALTADPVDNQLFHLNIDSARSQGAEFEAEWLREGGSSLKTSVSLQFARNGVSGEWLSNSPRQLFKLNYATPPLWQGALRGAIDYQFTSRRRTVLGPTIGGFGVLNLTLLSQPLGKNLELSATIGNLLDKRYADSPSEEHYDNSTPPRLLKAIAQDGRSWRVQATTAF